MQSRIYTKAVEFKNTLAAGALCVAAATGLFGCAAAVLGAAGTAGGIAYTDRGTQGEIKGDVSHVNQQAMKALQEMNIQVTGSGMQNSGQEQDIQAKSGTADVSVKMVSEPSNVTHVEVVAKEGTLKWNKDYAKEILAKIINEKI